jgi:hypothetical protein
MTPAYPGEMARRRCERRTRAELLAYQPKRPLALRDELRLRGMAARCATCRACALERALAAMLPPPALAGDRDGSVWSVVLKLAG